MRAAGHPFLEQHLIFQVYWEDKWPGGKGSILPVAPVYASETGDTGLPN